MLNDVCIVVMTISLAVLAMAKVIDMIADIGSAVRVERYMKADKTYNISKQQEENNNRVTISMPYKGGNDIDFPNSNH